MQLGQNVLILDDEPQVAEYLATVAEDLGFGVTATHDIEQFKFALHNYAPDLITLDLQMPELDGIEVLRLLEQRACEAKILLISGTDKRTLATAEELGRSLDLNMFGTLQKPILLPTLREHLVRCSKVDVVLTEKELQRAIREGRVFAEFQPIVRRCADGHWEIKEVEALARLRRLDGGVIYPNEFIGHAERWGLLDALTDVVLEDAIRQLRIWNDSGLDLAVAVNLSASMLIDSVLPDRIALLMQHYELDSSKLTLEITETAVMAPNRHTMEVLSRFRLKGFGLAVDDFGTGHSSLQKLYRMPFSELKIDRSFVTDAMVRDEARTIVEATILLAHKLGMGVCAEGVENEETFEFLRAAGCEKMQGYFFDKPVSADRLLELAREWRRD